MFSCKTKSKVELNSFSNSVDNLLKFATFKVRVSWVLHFSSLQWAF